MQETTLIAYLDMSGWMSPNGELRDVERDKLLALSGASPAVLRALVEKGIMETVKKSINRFTAADDTEEKINLSPLSAAQSAALNQITDGFRQQPVRRGAARKGILFNLRKNRVVRLRHFGKTMEKGGMVRICCMASQVAARRKSTLIS